MLRMRIKNLKGNNAKILKGLYDYQYKRLYLSW